MFNATIAKNGRPLGLDINYHDKETLLVTRVNAGPVNDYNNTDPDLLIAPGDRIMSVNGVSGSTNDMLPACQAAELKLTIRKCDEQRVMLEKRFPEQRLGFTAQKCDTVSLEIQTVDDDGDSLVVEYNRKGGFRLDKMMRIVGINSVYGNAEQLEAELKSADSFTLAIRQIFLQ